MTVDRGGLDYPIKVEYDARPLGRFNSDLDKSFKALQKLQSLSAKAIDTSASTSGLNRLSDSVDRANRLSRERSAALNREARGTGDAQRAIQSLNRESRRREIQEARAVRAQRQRFRLQRREITDTLALEKANSRITRVLNRQKEVRATLEALKERGLQNDRQIRRSLGLETNAERRLRREKSRRRSVLERLQAAQKLQSNERLKQLRAQLQATEAVTRAEIRQRRDAILRSSGRPDLIPGSRDRSRPTEETVSFFRRLNRTLLNTDNRANRVSFTFRRLFGILAAFAVARNLIFGFQALVRTLIESSAAIERAEIGIASLLTAVGQVFDRNGNAVEGVEALAIAQEEARRQTQLLRADALLTTATFEQLAETFQVGLAPGLQAGLDVDQVRRFTVQISQAAAAIGLEQRQLAEEIRSILGGNINIRQTRIAAALGITNDDIRRAREAGTLFDFLTDRFQAFTDAGFVAARTFSGLAQRINDGFRLILQTGGIAFFEDLKDLLEETLESFIQLNDETGQVEPNDALVELVEILGEGLSAGVAEARRLRQELGAGEARRLAQALSSILQILAQVAGGAVQGIAEGISDITLGARVLTNTLRLLTGIDLFEGDTLRETIRLFVRISTIVLGISALLGAWKVLIIALGPALRVVLSLYVLITAEQTKALAISIASQKSLRSIRALLLSIRAIIIGSLLTSVTAIGAVLSALASPIGIIVAALVLAAAAAAATLIAVGEIIERITGVDVTLTATLQTLLLLVEQGFRGIFLRFQFFMAEAISVAKIAFFAFIEDISRRFERVFLFITRPVRGISRTLDQALDAVLDLNAEIRRGARESIQDERAKLGVLEEQRDAVLNRLDAETGRRFRQIVNENQTAGEAIGSRLATPENINRFVRLAIVIGEIGQELGIVDTAEERAAKTAEKVTDDIKGFINGIFDALVDVQKELEKTDQKLAELVESTEAVSDRPLSGLTGVARQATQNFRTAATNYLKSVRDLRDENLRLQESLSAAQALANSPSLSDEQRQAATANIKILEDQINQSLRAQENLRLKLLSVAALQTQEALRQANFEEIELSAQRALEAEYAKQLASLGRFPDLARQRVLLAQQELDLEVAKAAAQDRQSERNIQALQRELEALKQTRALLLEKLSVEQEFDQATSDALQATELGISQIQQQIDLLTARRDLENEIVDAKIRQLQLERDWAVAAQEHPIQAGAAAAAWERLVQLQDRFTQVQSIIGNAIDSFSQTMSSLIVDIFDPGKDVSVRERFARFLQGIAAQIISTLISLAVTAILLNALSGGILGPLIRGLGAVQSVSGGGGVGLAEGGRIDRKTARRARAHPAHHRKPQGRAHGGPGRRPKNLHPSDTVPIWVAPNEWVVKASSVARAGHDALERINAGLFEPGALRAAVGLEGPAKTAVAMSSGSAGKGFVSGGRVRASSLQSSPERASQGPVPAVVVANEQTMENLIAGGGNALRRFLDESGYQRR